MIRPLYLFILIFISYPVLAQERFPIWENINFSHSPVPCNPDSTLIFATNRVFDTSAVEGRFLGNCIDNEGKLRYTVTTCQQGVWTVFLQPSLDSALTFLPKDKNIVFFVHGDSKNFPIALRNSQSIQSLYNVNVISFDYPSLIPGVNGLKNFYNSRKNLKQSLNDFTEFLNDAFEATSENKFAEENKTLFLHSLGNYVLKQYVKQDSIQKPEQQWLDNIVINSAAVRQGQHRKWVEKLKMQERIYIISNKRDFTLKGAMMITFANQLGGNVKKPLARNAHYVNFTNVANRAHNFFLEPQLLGSEQNTRYFYQQILNGKELDFTNQEKFEKRKDKLGYDLR